MVEPSSLEWAFSASRSDSVDSILSPDLRVALVRGKGPFVRLCRVSIHPTTGARSGLLLASKESSLELRWFALECVKRRIARMVPKLIPPEVTRAVFAAERVAVGVDSEDGLTRTRDALLPLRETADSLEYIRLMAFDLCNEDPFVAARAVAREGARHAEIMAREADCHDLSLLYEEKWQRETLESLIGTDLREAAEAPPTLSVPHAPSLPGSTIQEIRIVRDATGTLCGEACPHCRYDGMMDHPTCDLFNRDLHWDPTVRTRETICRPCAIVRDSRSARLGIGSIPPSGIIPSDATMSHVVSRGKLP
jgi:hypothetical protein